MPAGASRRSPYLRTCGRPVDPTLADCLVCFGRRLSVYRIRPASRRAGVACARRLRMAHHWLAHGVRDLFATVAFWIALRPTSFYRRASMFGGKKQAEVVKECVRFHTVWFGSAWGWRL